MNNQPLDHQEIRSLLPWYVNRTVDKDTVEAIDQHLPECLTCRLELQQFQDLALRLNELAANSSWQAQPGHLNDVLGKIDAIEKQAALVKPSIRPRAGAYLRGHLNDWKAWLLSTPTPIRWVVATQMALLLVMSPLLLRPPAGVYHTLSQESPATTTTKQTIRMVFDDAISERDLRRLLLEMDASIVAGPSSLGVYTVRVNDVAVALARARQHPQVNLAEAASP